MQEHDRIWKLTDTSNDNDKHNNKQKQDRTQNVTHRHTQTLVHKPKTTQANVYSLFLLKTVTVCETFVR